MMNKFFRQIGLRRPSPGLPLAPEIFCFALLLSVTILPLKAETPERPGPNIVLIFADDLGWKDVGYNGDGFYETPNIDKLAKEGMVFTSAYAPGANCQPSRACLISGNYTPRHEVYAVGSTKRGPSDKMRLVPVPNKNGLQDSNLTVADALKAAGYTTGHFGKWHLWNPKENDGALPSQQGFDVTFDSFGNGPINEGGEPHEKNPAGNANTVEQAPGEDWVRSRNEKGPPEDPKGVFTLTNEACAFMEKNQDRKFFVYLAQHAVHVPIQGAPEKIEKFRAKGGRNEEQARYAACVYALDQSVGLLMDKLEALGLEKNTMVIFTSDNGGNIGTQEPLRGTKGSYYDGGIRVPFIVSYPGFTKPGSVCDVPISLVDLFPTFLELADTPVPQDKILDGESLVKLLKGSDSLTRQAIYWHFPGYLDRAVNRGREIDLEAGFRSRPVSVIRKGDWKLHLFHEEWILDGGRAAIDATHAVELYHIKADIGERNDLASLNTAKRDELLDDLLTWMQATDAKMAAKPDLAGRN